ncbi:MAG TPA: hypothetical protein VNW04_11190, partial [Puia sp.]|nr:hypothetical protein [Puia sp.]
SIFIVLLYASCSIFEKNERQLAQFYAGNGDKIEIYFVTLGATTNDVIQVRRIKAGRKSEILKAFEKYNFLESSRMLNDSMLQLIVCDTGYSKTKSDTIILSIK